MATTVPPASYAPGEASAARQARNWTLWTAKTKASGRGYASSLDPPAASDTIVIPSHPMRKIHEIPPDTRT